MTTAAQHPGDALTQIGRLPDVEAVVAVEQARAVAQVAAQVQVAQRFPRDLDRVREELAAACDDYELAAVSFWALPNRGQGLSVHLARELAVIWGNVDYGVHELRRDDERGMSEVQAFCWDMQRNSRATRTFQVPHAITVTDRRTKVQSRQKIIDLQDVYRNNQNAGARAMRECVFATLPRWLVNTAERRLRDTKRRGPGTPLEDRITAMIAGAERFRVTRAQLERRVGKPAAAWSHEDVSDLEVIAGSIVRGDTTVAEQFDPAEAPVSVDELTVPDETPPGADVPSAVAEPVGDQRPATQNMVGKVIGLLRDLDVEDDDAQRAWLSAELQRPVESRRSLTRAEASTVIPVLELLIAERGEQPGADG
jgi:hypothetical protein